MDNIIESIQINIESEKGGLRLRTEYENVLIKNLTYDEAVATIKTSFEIVKNHFQAITGNQIRPIDLKQVSIKIVLRYMHIYVLGRTLYRKERGKNLTFNPKDFDHPQTKDLIIQFFKTKYPDDYRDKCMVMLNMSPQEFAVYEQNREDFQNMF